MDIGNEVPHIDICTAAAIVMLMMMITLETHTHTQTYMVRSCTQSADHYPGTRRRKIEIVSYFFEKYEIGKNVEEKP